MPLIPKNPMPSRPADWLVEIATAYRDAAETIPLGPMVGVDITADKLFHVAPNVCLKFRGIEPTPELCKKVTEAALTSYIATKGKTAGIFAKPHIAFAFAYLAAHFGLDLLDAEAVSEIMEFVEANEGTLLKLIEDPEYRE